VETYRVTAIEFDLEDDEDLRINEILEEKYLHSEWTVEDGDEGFSIADLISDECKWAVDSIDYKLIESN
jgi:hypothetical protein